MNYLNAVLAWFEEKPAMALMIVTMVVDVALGLLLAWQERKISSDISGKGMRRKATMIILVLLGAALEHYLKAYNELSVPAANVMALGFACSEALSIFENAALLGVKVPRVLTRAFEQLAEQSTKSAAKSRRDDALSKTLDHLDDNGIG